MRRIAIIGVPTNSSGTSDGVALAPAAYRKCGLIDALRKHHEVVDFGDVAIAEPSPARALGSGIIAEEALTEMVFAVKDACAKALAQKYFPLVLGGDCPILIGCLAAIGKSEKGLVFVDGHEDAYPPRKSPTGEAADMELGMILGNEISELPDKLKQILPLLEPEKVVVLGARDSSILENDNVRSIAGQIRLHTDTMLSQSNINELAKKETERLSQGNTSLWYHTDLDVLSSAALPAVDYRQAGGISWDELGRLSRAVLASEKVLGWNVTIYNPDLDPDLESCRTIVRFLENALS